MTASENRARIRYRKSVEDQKTPEIDAKLRELAAVLECYDIDLSKRDTALCIKFYGYFAPEWREWKE